MFETESGTFEESRPGRRARAGTASLGASGEKAVFPPAPFFLLALGVGLLIGLAMLAVGGRRQ